MQINVLFLELYTTRNDIFMKISGYKTFLLFHIIIFSKLVLVYLRFKIYNLISCLRLYDR